MLNIGEREINILLEILRECAKRNCSLDSLTKVNCLVLIVSKVYKNKMGVPLFDMEMVQTENGAFYVEFAPIIRVLIEQPKCVLESFKLTEQNLTITGIIQQVVGKYGNLSTTELIEIRKKLVPLRYNFFGQLIKRIKM